MFVWDRDKVVLSQCLKQLLFALWEIHFASSFPFHCTYNEIVYSNIIYVTANNQLTNDQIWYNNQLTNDQIWYNNQLTNDQIWYNNQLTNDQIWYF